MRHHSLKRKLIVVRPLKEVLFRVRVRPQLRPVRLQHGAKIRSVPARQQQRILRHLRVLGSDHLKLQIGHQILDRHRAMPPEVLTTQLPRLFTPVADKQNTSPQPRPACQRMRQLEHRRRSGRIIICAVIDHIAIHRLADPKMIQVRRQQNRPARRITPRQIPDRVVRCPDRPGKRMNCQRNRLPVRHPLQAGHIRLTHGSQRES